MYGCTLEQWKIVRGDPLVRFGQSPIQQWKMQRLNALKRGIEWQFSLWDWWCCWQASGHWAARGVHGDEYVMCRHGDIGPYSRSNVYFATARQNLQDARTSGKTRAPAKAGHGRGYWRRPNCKSKPYAASARGKLLGYFATEDEARAAYLAAFE
jgi:hypothetical protein